MKARTIIWIVIVLAVIIALGVNFKPKPPGGKSPSAGAAAGRTDAPSSPDPVSPEAAAADWLADLDQADVEAIRLSAPGGTTPVELVKTDGVWRVASLYSVAADSARVARLLEHLFAGGAEAVPEDFRARPDVLGLEPGQGAEIALRTDDSFTAIRLGYSPADDFASVYATRPDRGVEVLVKADLRGDIGLWNNDSAPKHGDWLERGAFSVDLSKLTGLDFESPGQSVNLVKDEQGRWLAHGESEAWRLDEKALSRWFADLAAFQVADAADPDRYFDLGLASPTHCLRFGLEEGVIASVGGVKGEDGVYYVEVSSQPGIPYILPEWRFNLYFRRLPDIFPGLAKRFAPAEARFADIRRDGVAVKLVKRDGSWQAVGFPHPLLPGAAEKWVAAIASWRPEDRVGSKSAQPIGLDAPTVEISLDGEVRRYRLGDMDPLLGARRIEVDSRNLLTADDATVDALFPALNRLFDFTVVEPGFEGLAEEVSQTLHQHLPASAALRGPGPVLPPEPPAEEQDQEPAEPEEQPAMDLPSEPEPVSEPESEPEPEPIQAPIPVMPMTVEVVTRVHEAQDAPPVAPEEFEVPPPAEEQLETAAEISTEPPVEPPLAEIVPADADGTDAVEEPEPAAEADAVMEDEQASDTEENLTEAIPAGTEEPEETDQGQRDDDRTNEE